ncbi:unnamed protein product [Acanthoscelides obtectus]|uniref:Uncharacterized protein n=1 Tax=Acanthoscelides obtectus TaxID=200917 RepID=A0A9P0JZ78_ACAOB|nr:unnamed protein product [Acanthoscelides obtectus]CAK1669648.1 hypothetical protein AOBTE_LOCUS27128 [Acanthoscelides obtectus]
MGHRTTWKNRGTVAWVDLNLPLTVDPQSWLAAGAVKKLLKSGPRNRGDAAVFPFPEVVVHLTDHLLCSCIFRYCYVLYRRSTNVKLKSNTHNKIAEEYYVATIPLYQIV